jgi:hypothetical protein
MTEQDSPTLHITISPERTIPRSPYLTSLYQDQVTQLDPIAYFKGVTSAQNPHLNKVMGSLNGKIAPEDFSRFCEQFASGMEYVQRKYGTHPSAVILRDEGNSISYCLDDNCAVILSRELIIEHMIQGQNTAIHTHPFVLDPYQAAFCIGVEEAFHAHQFATNPEYYHKIADEDDKLNIPRGSPDYDTQRVEAEAREVVHRAMIDTGIVHTAPVAPVNLDPKHLEWAAPYLRERTVPANTTTPFKRIITISADGLVQDTPASELMR